MENRPVAALPGFVDRVFHKIEQIIYLLISIILLLNVFFLVFSVFSSIIHVFDNDDIVREVVEVIDITMLILMIVEILYTIRVSLKEHALKAEPFIIVALIAAIRRILIISVEMAYLTEKFDHHMIEISILGVLVLFFVVSIILLRRSDRELQTTQP